MKLFKLALSVWHYGTRIVKAILRTKTPIIETNAEVDDTVIGGMLQDSLDVPEAMIDVVYSKCLADNKNGA